MFLQLEKFRNHNSQWLSMVETQQDNDDTNDFGNAADEDGELPNYLTTDYFDHCLLDNLNEDGDANNRTLSANSSGRPTSRYEREMDMDADLEYFDSNKMQNSNGDLWKYVTPPSED